MLLVCRNVGLLLVGVIGCREKTLIRKNSDVQFYYSIRCDPADTNCTVSADGSAGSLETLLFDPRCPAMEDMNYWERLEVLGNDSYDYEDEVGSQPGSFAYDDPRDYEEWCDWNDTLDPPVSIGVVDSGPILLLTW